MNAEQHENGQEKGEAYVNHVSFHHEEEVDSLSMLEGCHEEALIENNQQFFDLQVVVPKYLATDLNDQKIWFVHDDIHEVPITK